MIKADKETIMASKHSYSIVVGIDFCPPCDSAVHDALCIAADHPNSEMHVVHVLDPKSGVSARTVRIREQEFELRDLPDQLRAYVTDHTTRLDRAGSAELGVHIRIGDAVEALLQMAVDVEADFVVVGTHGHEGLKRLTLGSVAEQLVRTAPCPVLVSRRVDYTGLTVSERITPACPDCLETRARTRGRQWWCDFHASTNATQPAWHPISSVQAVRWGGGSADVHGYGTAGTDT